MPDRLAVTKTYKLFIGGRFPRSESGRSIAVGASGKRPAAHLCRASRKDLRAAVEAARGAQPGWAGATAYLRGQILYRAAEMLEGKREEMASALDADGAEVDRAVDRLVAFAGWADKLAQVLGGANPVAGPYHNFTVPEATGVVGVIAPDRPALLGLVSLVAPALCVGNTVVVLASTTEPIPAAVLAEVFATSDVPGGVVNILTGDREELVPHFASHRDVDAIHAADVSDEHARVLREGAAENLKRVAVLDDPGDRGWLDAERFEGPRSIEPFVEMKTIWHPSAS